ncbi:BRCT domain-containing protein [Caenorhabditis elegans]|uniref:BRCT domain-containing protein n=1 Tax=Caenorhabditis elegans TaxID=6239 RepID=O45463_CAEEL|nr:BRCT domain-containing protein [Caenorhabditis elegans]CAB04319.3 BRCT domain-containing protein [Caenorhabditis elegans]|eukprot:NP_507181.3 Uncharacterized protein CELE_F36D3.5 [Caenorhabditis elegans]
MQITNFYFIIVIQLGCMKIGQSASSDLQAISEQFRILSRVTNAISLQAGAIRKEIKARDLLSELLHMPSDQLNTVMNVNVEAASLELKRMHQEYTKLIQLSKNDTQALSDDDVKAMMATLSFILFFSQQSSSLSALSSISTKKLLSEAGTLSSYKMFATKCAKLSLLEDFIALFDDDTGVTPDSATVAEIINNFYMEEQLMNTCIDSLRSLGSKIEKLSNWKDLAVYRQLLNGKNNIIWFETHRESLSSMNSTLLQVLSTFQTAKPLWNSPSSLGQKMVFEAMAQLNKSIVEAKSHNISPVKQNLLFTAGFKNSGDFSKIAGDLNSNWFKKHVAKGSSTNSLSNALEIFQTISGKMVALDSSWKELMHVTKGFQNLPVVERVNNAADVATIGLNFSKLERIIQDSRIHINNCMKETLLARSKLKSFDASIVEYEKYMFPAENIMNRLANIKDIIAELTVALNFMVYPNTQARDLFKDDCHTLYWTLSKLDVNTSNAITVKNMLIRDFKKLTHHSYSFIDTMKSIAKISSELKIVEKTSAGIYDSDGPNLGDLVSELELVKTSQCFSHHSETIQELMLIVHKLYSTRYPPDHATSSTMHEYLDRLEKVQNNLALVEKEIKSSSSQINATNNPVLLLKTPQALIKNIGTSTRVLEDLENVRQHRQFLFSVRNFTADVKKVIVGENLIEWFDPEEKLIELLEEADQLNEFAGKLRNGSLTEMSRVFDEAAKIKGINGDSQSLNTLSIKLQKSVGIDQLAASKVFQKIREFNLDFAKHEAALKSASVTVNSLVAYYDEIFGNSKSKILTIEKHIDNSFPWIYIFLICIGSMILIGLLCVVAYGFTKNGRAKYMNLYLYYFGKPLDYERRWRYSLFLDNQGGKNTLLDAVREINKTHVVKAVKMGAYINAFNKFGNTALHVATKSALPEIVKILIEHGADLTLLNTLNKTPEQMIPLASPDHSKDMVEKLEKIRMLYKKANGKKYRMSVPQKFPATSFHIWMDERTDNKITNDFMEKFQAITSDEAAPNTTHVIVKTDENGVLETDDLDLLFWVFNGAIIVKEQWMIDCLNEEKLIEQDSKYLVDSVKYKGSTFKTVLQWSEAMAKGAIPYLYGVYAAIVMTECKNLVTLNTLVAAHGGFMMKTFPGKDAFNVGSRPYNHANLGPLFLIHDGTINLKAYTADPDKMYTLFTEEEFIKFMLQRNIIKDTRETPITVLKADK